MTTDGAGAISPRRGSGRCAAVLLVVLALAGCGPASGAVLNSKSVAGTTGVPRYDRAAFGGWAKVRGLCDTREIVVERDSADQAVDTDHDGCADDGMLVDVYTGHLILAKDAQVDHVYPLAEAWREGAYQWSPAQRRLFANDQSNLRAVLGRVNQDKSDLTPAEMLAPTTPPRWRPPTPAGRCAFATIYRATAQRWGLPIPPADDAALREFQSSC